MRTALILAGLSQLLLAAASLGIPRVLGWRAELRRLTPFTRHVFWTYSGYILGINLCMGALSLLAPHWLLEPAPLARAVCLFIAVYWGVRLGIQLTCYRSQRPRGRWFDLADAGFTALFALLATVYGAAAFLEHAG